MAGPLLIEALGHQFSVDVDGLPDAETAALRRQWARCRPTRAAGADEPQEILLSDAPDPVRRDYALASTLTFAAIRQAAGSGVMLHACGVADQRTGAVAVLVAPSGTGKTTAAARLCATRFGYVTDETILVRPDGSVLPYPKPSVVLASDDPYHKQQHGPDELDLQRPPTPLRATALILLDRIGRAGRDPDAPDPVAVPSLEPLGLIDTMMQLIPQTSSLTALERPMGALADLVVSLGGGHVLHYQDIEDAADLIGDLSARETTGGGFISIVPTDDDAARWTGAAGPDGPGPDVNDRGADDRGADDGHSVDADGAGDGDRVVTRSPFQDAVLADDEVLVLSASVPLRLTGLGATIWLTAQAPTTVADLTAVCIDRHGKHPQAAQLVRDAIDALVTAGALLLAPTPAQLLG